MDGNHANSDDFCMFSAGNIEGQNTVGMLIEDKPVNVIIDSGANCNLMSEEVLEFVTGGNSSLLECRREVYAYASSEPLQLRGKCNHTVQMPETHKSLSVEFLITRNKAATLLGRDNSEVLGVLRIGVPVNSWGMKHGELVPTPQKTNRKAALKVKFPKVFQGLGKLKNYQLKRRPASASNSFK